MCDYFSLFVSQKGNERRKDDSAGETNRETLLGAEFENVAVGCLMEGGWAFKLGRGGVAQRHWMRPLY